MERSELQAGRSSFLLERDMDEPELVPFASGRAAVYSSRCPDSARPNQDAAALIPWESRGGVLAVADGVGGRPGGERAARIALESLAASVEGAASGHGHLREAILEGFDRANRAILKLRLGAGTTLAVLEIRGCSVRTYHVGDSEILVVGQRGRVRLRTVSHSPVGYGVEAGLLDPREAMHHEDRHLLSNAVGSPEMRVEIGPVLRLRPRDTALLASDGLVDNLHGEEIVEAIRKGPIDRAAGTLARTGRERMPGVEAGRPAKPDDLTLILYRGLGAAKPDRS